MEDSEYNIVTAEKHAIAMMKQGQSIPISIRRAAKLFGINEYELAKRMGVMLDLFSFDREQGD